MINLIIKDGLGNQMFQYAYARYLQECYRQEGVEEKLVINPYFIHHTTFQDNDFREMSIQHFVLNTQVSFQTLEEQKKSMSDFKIKILKATNIVDLFNWKVRKIKPAGKERFLKRVRHGLYYTFFAYSNYGAPLCECKNKYVFGFFQDEHNFHPIADIIRAEFIVKDNPSEKNRRMIEHIKNVNSICLHIRRGDYLNPRWANLQICTFDYYNNAINEILRRVEKPVFFVFSNSHNDLEWIRENYHFRDVNGEKDIELVYVDLENPDYEELRLMYSCKHFIISNSTFSWWGAYLSTYPQKMIFVPERWNLAVDNDISIFMKDWIKVKL
jgi:hypothetical protein